MLQALFNTASEAEKDAAIEGVIQRASPRQDFFLMLTLSVAMAVFGILLGSQVILIGSMLIAPLLYPVLSLALGVIVADEKLIGRSIVTLLKSTGLGLAAGFLIGILFAGAGASDFFLFNVQVGGPSSLMYALVAAIAGFAAAFAVTKTHLNETLPGVAISVALVPPLALAGVGLAMFNWAILSNALLLFLVNVIGIMFSAMIVFALFNFSRKKSVTQEAIKEEEKEIQKEKDALAQK